MSAGQPPARVTPETWARVNDLFHAALDRAPAGESGGQADEVSAFLDQACAGDGVLRVQVEGLLAAHRRAGDFLAGSALDGVAELLAAGPEEPSAVGRQIGAYQLVAEIGRGGMGAVYLAERADDEYRKRVAIKLIKRGMDSDAVLRHFRNERQILASLEHPNIARLLDGGTTEDGTPYFVMEYIEGLPIDDYCAAHGLPLAQRLELFLRVGGAVAYAHQRLVVHRDIKPSNILVAPDGSPRLLDFGIAKLLDPERGDQPPATATLPLMTPEYASPEQIQGLPATTLTDVYSLGVVLYELLTGTPPHDVRGRPPHEIARVICGDEPERPSARGSRRLRGDLDNIALRALRKDPARRYRSVEALCEDVRRHMVGLPVTARPETFAYRASKFVRRNRIAVAAAALVAATLVAGVVATSWQAHRARVQEEIARVAQARAERRFEDVRQLAHTVLFDYHDAIKDLAGATPVRKRLVDDALRYLDALASENGGDPSLQREMASAYERVGDVQGGDFSANLGDTTGALASYRKALGLRQALLAARPSPSARRDVAQSRDKLGMLLEETGDVAGAAGEMQAAMEMLEPLVVAAPADQQLRLQLASLHDRTGMMALDAGEVARSLEQHGRALDLYLGSPPAERASARVRRGLATAHDHLGSALIETGVLEDALGEVSEALAVRSALVAEFPHSATYRTDLAATAYSEGDVLGRLGRDHEALAAYRRSAAIAEELMAADPKSTTSPSYALLRIGDTLVRLGDDQQALPSYRKAQALRAAEVAADPANLWKRAALIEGHAKIGRTLARLGQTGDAAAACQEALALIDRTTLDPSNVIIGGAFSESYAELGDAYETLASDGRAPAAQRQAWSRAACDVRRRNAEFWRDLRARGLVSAVDAARPDAAARALSRCGAGAAAR